MRKKKIIIATAIMVALVIAIVIVTACGGKDQDSTRF